MRRSDPTWRTRPWHRLLLLAIAVLAASEGVKVVIRFEARAYRIPSASMSPTLLVGDFLYAEMATYRAQLPGRGDVVIYRYPGNPALEYVHRVVGLPNETIEVRNKQVFIDGLPLDETYVHHDDPAMWPSERGPRDQFGPFRIPADAVFVMGDQRDNSNDSRFWGPLRVTRIRGLARVLYWSWDGGTPRWERIGRPIE
jgi:signal peptidase I